MSYGPLDLSGRTAVVLGGTTGLGRAMSHGLAEAGADVIASARRSELVNAIAGEIEQRGRRTLRVPVDVTDPESLSSLLDACIDEFNKVDILVNSAGTTKKVSALEMDRADWNRILEVNLSGTMEACRVFGKQMIKRGWGRIINLASLASYVGLFEVAAYNASKAGVVGFTKSLAVEWARHGVCVNAIAPGVFPTDLNRHMYQGTERGKEILVRTPMQRFGRAEEIAGAAVFLASEAASFVTGEVIAVDGGFLASGVNQ